MISLRRYAAFYTALAGGLIALAFTFWLLPHIAVQASANTFFLVYLVLELVKIRSMTPDFLKKHAASTDPPAWVIVAITFVAVMLAVGSLFVLVNEGGKPNPFQLTLALTSVALGWMSIHTMTAIHYAHMYWRPDDQDGGKPGASRSGGLQFPGGDEPSGYDFLYYALVIGMTAQTADVDITGTAMRKLTLVHAILSFFFNTVLVAAAVNVVVSLAAG